MTNNDASARKIAEALGVCHRTVLQVRKTRHICASALTRSRARFFTARDTRAMECLMIAKPQQQRKLQLQLVNKWTARRAFHRIDLTAAVKQKKPALSEKNVAARIKFCKQHRNWRRLEESYVCIWSDEIKINSFQSDGNEYYWHRTHQ